MKSAEELRSRIGGNMRESMAQHRPSQPPPAPPSSHGEAAKYRGAARVKDALSIEIDRIIPDSDQPRKDFDEGHLAELAESLKARGQLQPIRARYDASVDRWVIIAGERRYRAAMMAGLGSLMAIESKGPADPGEILEDQLVENLLRDDLKPIEQARAFRTLIDRTGWSYRQLCEHLHVAPASVARALALLELPVDLQGRVESGELAPSVAYEVSRLDDPAAQREVAARVVAEGLNRSEAVEAVRQTAARSTVKRGGKAKASARKVTDHVIRTSAGSKVTVENRKGLDQASIVAALREALGRAESHGSGAAG